MKSKTLTWRNNFSMRNIISLLKKGKVVLGPTDTVLGLYAMPTEQGFLSLNAIKKRSKKPYLLLIPVSSELSEYVDSKDLLQAENIMKRFWPGPLTLIFKVKNGIPAYISSEEGTIAVRVPQDPFVQQLLAQTGPLFSTSANLSGEPIPKTLDDVNLLIKEQVAALIAGESDPDALPSTLLDMTGIEPIIVREGVYSKEVLKPFFSKK